MKLLSLLSGSSLTTCEATPLSRLNASLNILYRCLLKGIRIPCIPVILIAVLSGLIRVDIQYEAFKFGSRIATWFLYKTTIDSVVWVFPIAGFTSLSFEEVKERVDKLIKYIRVSSESQSDKSGKDRQHDALKDVEERLEPDEAITIADDWESGRTMLRSNIGEILETIRSDEESTYCVALEDIDRLSRAEPFEAAVFFWLLKEYDVILYFDTMGFYDFTDPTQQLRAFFGLYESRKEYNKINERTSEGQKEIKEEGGWPAKAPFGYEKPNKDNTLYICDEEATVIRDFVTTFLEDNRSVKDVWSEIDDKYDGEDVDIPAYTTFLDLLRREYYTGELSHEGEVVGEIPQIISKVEFEEIQEQLGEKSREHNEEEFDLTLKKAAIERFGLDSSIQLFDIIKGRCPSCGGDVESLGSTTRWGHRVLKYECVYDMDDNDSKDTENDGCGWKGPLLDEKFLMRWENKIPIICPLCQTPADDDEWTESQNKIGVIEQTCNECSIKYSINLSEENALDRGLELPEYAIRWFEDYNGDKDEEEESDSVKILTKETNDTASNGDHTLNEFY